MIAETITLHKLRLHLSFIYNYGRARKWRKRMVGGKEKVEESSWLDEENEVMQGVVKHKRTRESWKKSVLESFSTETRHGKMKKKWKWKNNEKRKWKKGLRRVLLYKSLCDLYKKRTCELRIVELMIKEWVTNNGIKKKEKEKKKKGIFSSRRLNWLGLNCLVFVAK